MGKSGYLAQKKAEIDEAMRVAERITRQFDMDTFQIALSRYEKISLGYQRIMEITALWEQVRREYEPAVVVDNESDVARSHMDEELLNIAKDESLIIEFEARYPELRKITYERRRKS